MCAERRFSIKAILKALIPLFFLFSFVEGADPLNCLAPLAYSKSQIDPKWISLESIQGGEVLEESNGGTSVVKRILLPDKGAVALKQLRPQSQLIEDVRPLFESEAFILSRLQHIPGMPVLHPLFPLDRVHPENPYLGIWEGQLFIVMEDVGDQSHLGSQSAQRKEQWKKERHSPGKLLEGELLTLRNMAQTVHQTSEILDKAHKKHIYHMDLEPSNLRGSGWKLKMMDWGMAIEWNEEGKDFLPRKMFLQKMVMGTPEYFPPEEFLRLEGETNDDDFEKLCKQRDFYSLSQTLLVLLTGSYLYQVRTAQGTFNANVWEKLKQEKNKLNPQSLRAWVQSRERTRVFGEMHPDLIQFFSQSLNPDPELRFQNWDDWNRAFQRALNKECARLQLQLWTGDLYLHSISVAA